MIKIHMHVVPQYNRKQQDHLIIFVAEAQRIIPKNDEYLVSSLLRTISAEVYIDMHE